MTTPNSRARRTRTWTIVGAAVLAAGLVALIIAAIANQATPSPTPRETTGGGPSVSITPGPTADGEFVEGAAVERGWRGEPITTDPEVYAAAALEAASTFDTTLSSREEWLSYLDSWFTPDTRYTSDDDQSRRLQAAQLELRQGVVLPEQEWESLAGEDGRVVAAAGDVVTGAVTDDASGDMAIGTADVVLTFTRVDGSGVESSYEESVRVSVQVLCGAGSVPTPDSGQQAGDCKVVRFFTEPVEP